VHFVGLFLSSLLKMHGPKNKIKYIVLHKFFYRQSQAYTLLQNLLH